MIQALRCRESSHLPYREDDEVQRRQVNDPRLHNREVAESSLVADRVSHQGLPKCLLNSPMPSLGICCSRYAGRLPSYPDLVLYGWALASLSSPISYHPPSNPLQSSTCLHSNPYISQTYSHLGAFAPALPSAWNTLRTCPSTAGSFPHSALSSKVPSSGKPSLIPVQSLTFTAPAQHLAPSNIIFVLTYL